VFNSRGFAVYFYHIHMDGNESMWFRFFPFSESAFIGMLVLVEDSKEERFSIDKRYWGENCDLCN